MQYRKGNANLVMLNQTVNGVNVTVNWLILIKTRLHFVQPVKQQLQCILELSRHKQIVFQRFLSDQCNKM